MADPFLSEIRMMSFSFPPKGWALCNGQTLPINQNQALFSLLSTTYGGNGTTTFQLPNLQGRVPTHMGLQVLGVSGGEQAHTLSVAELPTHLHSLMGTNNNATQAGATPNNTTMGYARAGNQMYGGPQSLVAMSAAIAGSVGGSQAHLNMQPFLTINFCIALQGVFPSQN